MIRPISAADTIAVRWPVLRPGFPRETAIFDGDDAATTLHFGAFADGGLVGVATLYPRRTARLPEVKDGTVVGVASVYLIPFPDRPGVSPAYQLRGMATLPEVRGAGFGKALLDACVAAAREHGAGLLWCNARTSAVPFYEKNGWQTVGAEFDIPTVGPHFRMFVSIA
jgi:GNAT superfamily N-acetyltransferase